MKNKESGGVCSLSTDNGRLALTVSNVGKVNYAVQLCYDVIPLYKNGVYRLKYDISSTQDRFIEAMIQQNGGTYKAYTWKGINLTSTPQTVDYEFTMRNTRVSFPNIPFILTTFRLNLLMTAMLTIPR